MNPEQQVAFEQQMAWMAGLLKGRIRQCGVELDHGVVFSMAGLWDLLKNLERGGN